MSSTGWFILASIFGFSCPLVLFIYLDERETAIEKTKWLDFIGLSSTLALFIGLIICVVCGFRAPDKMHTKDVVNVMNDKQIRECVHHIIKNMSVEEKYKILTSVESEQ